MTESNKLYSPPSIPALTTYISVVVVLFLAGLNFAVFRELDQLRTQLQDLREETSKELSVLRDKNYRLELSLATRDSGSTRIAVAPVPAPVPAPPVVAPQPRPVQPVVPAPAPATPVAAKPVTPVRPVQTVPETPVVAAKEPDPAPVVSVEVPPMPVAPKESPVETVKVPEIKPVAKPLTGPEEIMALAPTGDAEAKKPAPKQVEIAIPPMPSTRIEAVPPKIKPAALSAQLLATNPDQRRIIISVGSSNGVQKGQRFAVHRGGKWVGDVTTSRVFADMAMCDIVTPTPLGMRVGDIAKLAGDSSNR